MEVLNGNRQNGGVVFDRVWCEEKKALEWQDNLARHRKLDLEVKIREFSELAREANSERVRRSYEVQMDDAAKELEELEHPLVSELDLSVPYRTALEKSTGMLKNPISIWDSVDVHEKHRLFFFLFEAKLAYTRNEGYRTGDSLSATRIFEEFVTSNARVVEVGRIELPSKE